MNEPRKTRRTSTGECAFCHRTLGKGGISRHLEACPARRAALEAAAAAAGAKKTRLFHLVVAGRELPDYWMHLEVPGRMTLGDLDAFLRDEWLECCGHLSAFTLEGKEYMSAGGGTLERGERSMDYRLDKVLRPGVSFLHEYDFGTTTELALQVVSEREGKGPAEEILIMARNLPPDLRCSSCGKSATQVCSQCIYDGSGWLCDECAKEHECGEEMLLPVVNSPRVGVCGYTG